MSLVEPLVAGNQVFVERDNLCGRIKAQVDRRTKWHGRQRLLNTQRLLLKSNGDYILAPVVLLTNKAMKLTLNGTRQTSFLLLQRLETIP